MATQTSPHRFSWLSLGISVLVAIGLGVGVAYVVSNLPEKTVTANQAPPAAPAEAPPPPKIDFYGAGTVTGNTSTLPKDKGAATAELGVDDAMIVWLKMEVPGGGGTSAAPGGRAAAPASMTPSPAGAGGGGGGRGGGRGPRAPLTIKDPEGRDYSYSLERKDGGILALHLKRGYDKKPAYLTVAEMAGDRTVASWKIENVPAPKEFLTYDTMKGKPLGEVQIHEGGRGGRVTASAHLDMKLPPDQGVILHPIAASFTPIDSSRTPGGIVAKPGASVVDGRLNLPNPTMAKFVSFDMQTFAAVQTFEDVTFKTGRIESRFGQPTFVVDADEIVTTKSGVKVALTKQDEGPKHQPRRIHSDVTIRLMCSGDQMKVSGVTGIAPGIDAEILQPTPESLGLSKLSLSFFLGAMPEGQKVFDPVAPPTKTVPEGTFKFGPTPITIRLKITQSKALTTQRIVLPVNPKLLPPDPNAGGGGNAVMAPAPQLRIRG